MSSQAAFGRRTPVIPPLGKVRRMWNTVDDWVGGLVAFILVLSGFAWAGSLGAPWSTPARFVAGLIAAGIAWGVASGIVHICFENWKWESAQLVSSSCACVLAAFVGMYSFGRRIDWFGPNAFRLGFCLGICVGYPCLLLVLFRDDLADRRGRPWPRFPGGEVNATSVLNSFTGGEANRETDRLLSRTMPRAMRRSEIQLVDVSDVGLNPKMAERWLVPPGPAGRPRGKTTRRLVRRIAVCMGIPSTKVALLHYCDEATTVRMLVRVLSDKEWRWVKRAWVALDREADPAVLASMDPWEWIARQPHSERNLEQWEAYWKKNLRDGLAEYRARKLAEGDPRALEIARLKRELSRRFWDEEIGAKPEPKEPTREQLEAMEERKREGHVLQ